MIELACLGRAAVDLYGEQTGCPLEAISTFARYLGGSPANTAVGGARLGLATAMITRVGDEQNGRFVRDELQRAGVDVSQVRTDPERLTALVFLAIRNRDEFPHVFYRDRCADMALAPEDIDDGFLARCRALLVSGTHLSTEGTLAACKRAIEAVRRAGGRVILDIDYRPVLWGRAPHADGASRSAASRMATRRLAEVLPDCDLVVGTEEEFRVAGGQEDLMHALLHVRSLTSALLVLKRGPSGCIAFDGAIPGSLRAGLVVGGFPVEVFNVLGAGDAFMAGFLRGWLRDEPLRRCCEWANACGALVVSRHGCAPAMPSWTELERFIATGPRTPRVREDAELEHVHRATTRGPVAAPLFVLAFDHRTQLEAMASASRAAHSRVATFKGLIAEAFEGVSARHPGAGVIVDDRHGTEVLAYLTGRGHWIARPVEAPGSIPLAFEAGDNLGLHLRTWPREHVAKCLLYYSADDVAALREAQLLQLRTLASACRATDRELLIEVLPSPQRPAATLGSAEAVESIYRAGIRPDWWKLPPSALPAAWKAIDAAIDKHDPLCGGVLILGMDATAESLGEGFAAARASRRVRGFAVGRSIFNTAAQNWFGGRWSDAQALEDIARRYEAVIAAWQAAWAAEPQERHTEKERA